MKINVRHRSGFARSLRLFASFWTLRQYPSKAREWSWKRKFPATLAALDGLVRAGKVRWLGASNFNAAQLTTARERQMAGGLERFQVVQNNHNYAVSDLEWIPLFGPSLESVWAIG